MGLKTKTSNAAIYILRSVVVFFILAHSSLGQELIKNRSCYEREDIVLRFESNIEENNCNFTIDFNSTIFALNSERINPNSLPEEKIQRTTVTIAKRLNIAISINKTGPSDSGNYTCVFRCRNSTLIQIYIVTVFHPPILTGCDWERNPTLISTDYTYESLVCTFKDGHPSGNAICYGSTVEGKDFILPVTISVDGKLKNATFLIKKETEFSCCVVNEHYKKNSDKCNEYQRWNDSRSTDIASIYSTSSRYTTSFLATRADASYSQESNSQPNTLLIALICVTVICFVIIIVSVIVLIIIFRKQIFTHTDDTSKVKQGTVEEKMELNLMDRDNNDNDPTET